ncbi:MAG: GNAT family N-acetyltransferase [Candidatus Omnitrophica bacterium]|nr:GNAT family N-acetyltransferase [Candidatus Omnitrophota bacterium]
MNPEDLKVKTLPLHRALKELDLPALNRNLFSSPDWMSVIYKTYRTRLFIKYIEREGKVASYILYAAVKNFLEWKICIASYCDYCDGYVQKVEDWQAFFDSLKEEYPQYRIAIRSLRDEIVRQVPGINELSRERFHVLDVRDDTEKVWRRTTDSFRAAVRQSERQGVVVKRCEKSELKKFYDLHLQVRKYKHHVFPQPYRFFDIIWQEYMDQGKGALLGAYDKDGVFIGGNIFLECGNTLYYKFNTSLHTALKLRPNNRLFWEGMKYAKEKNLGYIDLGSSGYDQKGLILFKNQTGAKMMDIVHLGYHPDGYKFSEKRILRFVTKICTLPWMPDSVLRVGSHLMYPFLA